MVKSFSIYPLRPIPHSLLPIIDTTAGIRLTASNKIPRKFLCEKNAHHDVVAATGKAAMPKTEGISVYQRALCREPCVMRPIKKDMPIACAVHSMGTRTSGIKDDEELIE